jgi:hypothetical protein
MQIITFTKPIILHSIQIDDEFDLQPGCITLLDSAGPAVQIDSEKIWTLNSHAGGQLISCDCWSELLQVDNSPGTWAYNHGLTEEQFNEWMRRMTRVPFILYPNICGRCGSLWPEMFRVSDEEWKHYVPIVHRRKMLCRPCFDTIKHLIDSHQP